MKGKEKTHMAKEQAIEFLKLLESDEALHEKLRNCSPQEAAQAARGLSFDVTEAELAEAVDELRSQRATQNKPELVPDSGLDKVVGGMFGDGESAPDGHEMGCFLRWYGNEWQEKNKIYCQKMNLCDKHFHVCLLNPNRSHNPIMDS